MKKKNKNLEFLLETVLSEDTPAPMPQNAHDAAEPESYSPLSLDSEIDSYIIRYEKESIPTTETYEDELFNQMGESKIQNYKDVIVDALNEAEEDEEVPAEDPADEEENAFPDLDSAEPASNEENNDAEGQQVDPIMNTPQINLQDFARSIARLVNNYDALMNPKNVILNRVKKYIEMNYDVKTAKELMEILDVNYSLTAVDNAGQEWPTPYAAGALSTEG